MIENTPLKPIPLPSYNIYKTDLCARYNITYPLRTIPFEMRGNLGYLPNPLNSIKSGWPWNEESQVWNMEAAPKISVIIPSYQQGKYIEETLRSVLLQNYPNLEVIIIDGGSTDETISVLNHYKEFVSVFISEKDRGQSHALNKGFSLANGDIYYWVNSDDYLNKNSFNIVMPYFINNNNLDIVYGNGLSFNEDTKQLTIDYSPLVLERYLRFGGIVFSHSVLWRSRVHCAIWEDLHCAMDAELWLRLFTGNKVKHCYYPIGVARLHSAQKTANSKEWAKKWEEDFKEYIWKYYPIINKRIWRLRVYEYTFVQKIFRLFNAKLFSFNSYES